MGNTMESLLSDLAQFHFLRPFWLLGLIPACTLVLLLVRKKSSVGSWKGVISPHLLPHLIQGNAHKPSPWPYIFLALCMSLSAIALAGPTWKKLPQAVQKKINAQVVVLDLSLSMYADDIPPSRLTRAKHKLSDILSKTEEGLTGLVVFSGMPHVVSPLTDDTNTIMSMVNSLSPDIMPLKGSDTTAALKKAKEVLLQSGLNEGHIILMTDEIEANLASKAKQFLDTSKMPVSIYAIGTSAGAPIRLPNGSFVKNQDGGIVVVKTNERTMREAANKLHGRFTTISATDDDINYLLGYKTSLLQDEVKETQRDFDAWEEMGHWLVLLILPFAAAGYRKGWLGVFLLPLLLTGHSPDLRADTWDNLWNTPNQQGAKAYEEGQYGKAQSLFDDPLWKGTAAYRAGDFEAAAELFGEANTATGYYNQGNAFAQQGQLEAAETSYDQALEIDPNHAAAKANKALVEKLLKQQKQQEQSGDGDKEGDDKKPGDDQEKSDDPSDDSSQDGEQEQDSSEDSSTDSSEKSGDQSSEEKSNQQQDSQQQSGDQGNEESTSAEDSNNTAEDSENAGEEQKPEPGEPGETSEEDQQGAGANEENAEPTDDESEPSSSLEGKGTTEDEQALNQWLRRIPDDPGGLLRRKFSQESQLRNNSSTEKESW